MVCLFYLAGKGALSSDVNRTKYDRVTPWSHDHAILPEPLNNIGVIRLGELSTFAA